MTACPKVTLHDGTEWEGNSLGHMWGTRNERYYTGQTMHPWTEDGAKQLLMRVRHSALETVLRSRESLTDEQRAQIGDLARTIRKAQS